MKKIFMCCHAHIGDDEHIFMYCLSTSLVLSYIILRLTHDVRLNLPKPLPLIVLCIYRIRSGVSYTRFDLFRKV